MTERTMRRPPPAVPTIALDGGDIDQPQEITNPMSVKIGVTAPGAIAGFTVTIDSPALTAEMLATVGLATELNLVNPGSMAEALGALGFPSGEAVSGKTALTFDISKLVPMIAQIYNETSDHKFILKVTDAKGKSTTKTLTCHLTGKVALAYNNDADLWANTATVTAANVPDGGSVQYRVKGAADWTDAVLVEGSKYRLAPVYETSKNAAGLDVHTIKAGTGVFAATTYEVRIAKDGQAVDSKEFATAVGDKIPNGDMSGWSKRIWIDGSNNEFPITYPNPDGMKVWTAAIMHSSSRITEKRRSLRRSAVRMRRSRGRPVCRPVWSLALFSLREICSPAISIIRASPGRSISVSLTPGRPVRVL